MELMTIYNLSNYENEELKISKENNTIEVELANFNQKAKQHKTLGLKAF
jgi:hypothetical protein